MEKQPMDTTEHANEVAFIELGEIAEGSIGETIETRPRLEELTQRLGNGEFHVETPIVLPCGCIDGRCGGNVRPDTAGGTLSLVVADDLLSQQYAGDGSTLEAARNVYEYIAEAGYEVGGHTADEVHGDGASGCGANDKLQAIYRIIGSEKSATIRELAGAFGATVSDETHQSIIEGATRRSAFSSGESILNEVILPIGGEDSVDTLVGEHKEVVAVVNHRTGTTLDRDALEREFGKDYEAFNIDAWSFENGARALYPDADDATIERTVAAMVYYNIATAIALCGPTMRVIVLE